MAADVTSRFVCPHCKKGFELLAGLKDHLVTEHLHGRSLQQQQQGSVQHEQATTSTTLRPPPGISSPASAPANTTTSLHQASSSAELTRHFTCNLITTKKWAPGCEIVYGNLRQKW